MRSFGENTWTPLLLLVGVGALLCLVALRLESTRDLGAGLLPDHPGPRTASTFTQTPFGLTLRLQRWSILGWSIGIIIGGLFYGTVATSMANLLGGASVSAKVFIGSLNGDILTGLLGYFTMANALLIAAFVLQSVATVRAEEADGSVELQWTGALSRVRWAASRIAVPAIVSLVVLAISGYAEGASYGAAIHDSSQPAHYAMLSIAYWPTMLLFIGLVVFLTGWLPRVALTASWVIYGLLVLVSMFGALFTLPKWVTDNGPFTAIEHLSTKNPDLLPLIVLAALAVILTALGLLRLRSRDFVSS